MVKIVDINPSTKKNKKLVATLDDGTSIHFGSKNSQTYLDHQDKDKRFNYLKRHMANQNEAHLIKNNKVSPATLSARLLWGATTNLNKNVEILNRNLTY
jgi:hypothetical protein